MPRDYRRRRRRRDPFGRTREGPPAGKIICDPSCRFFICTKKALVYDRRTGKFMCNYTGDECIGGECAYAKCLIGALLGDGRCRLALTRGEREIDEEREYEEFEKEFEEEDLE